MCRPFKNCSNSSYPEAVGPQNRHLFSRLCAFQMLCASVLFLRRKWIRDWMCLAFPRAMTHASPLLIRCSIIGNAPPFLSELSSGDMPIACGPFAVIFASFISSWSSCPFVSPNQPVTSGMTFLVAILCRAWTNGPVEPSRLTSSVAYLLSAATSIRQYELMTFVPRLSTGF